MYWDSRNKVFFKDKNEDRCYIAERSQEKDDYATYYVRERYTKIFDISGDECKSINSVLMSGNVLFAVTDDGISIFNLDTKKVKKHKIRDYSVLGIKGNEIYFRYKNRNYKLDKENNKKVKLDDVPKEFDFVSQKFDFSENVA